MDTREYLTVRRSYNLVRHDSETGGRLTFPEFAILCRLSTAGGSLKTSEIADYQGSLRPTMTHRTKHLESLSLIERQKGQMDKRNVVCTLTPEGNDYVCELCSLCCRMIKTGQPLSRIDAERMCRYVDAMGSLNCKAGDLVLLGIWTTEDEGCSITELVDLLGLLQPTVSMSVSALVSKGFVARVSSGSSRTADVVLTGEGKSYCGELVRQIGEIVVRRRSRTSK